MSHVFKNYLYTYSAKKKVTPAYTYQEHKRGFCCQVTVPGFTFTANGVGRNKKEAQGEAAKSFCEQLKRFKLILPSELPELGDGGGGGEGIGGGFGWGGAGGHTGLLPVPQEPMHVSHSQFAATPSTSWDSGISDNAGMSAHDRAVIASREHLQRQGLKRRLEDQSGNWTLENAKCRLILFMEKTRQHMNVQYRATGPIHNQSFVAEMSVNVPSLHTTIHGREQAGNKKLAMNALALNLVLQLHKLGVLEDAPPPGAKKPSAHQIDAKEVLIPVDLEQSMSRLLTNMNITPVHQLPVGGLQQPVSVLLPPPLLSSLSSSSSSAPVPGRVQEEEGKGCGPVAWTPPSFDWNPWTQRPAVHPSIHDPLLTTDSRTQKFSRDLQNDLARKRSHDTSYQTLLRQRHQLPIAPMCGDVVAAVRAHSVVVVKGSTGCGKTTQVPQFVLDDMIDRGLGAACNIVVTQPRRISAISVAERVSYERMERLGVSVGYSVRFESYLPRHFGSILFCTVGVLLRKMEAGLVGVSHVIVDEIHERDLNTDFLLVLLKDMLQLYPNLRVLLMSATIDTDLFTRYFDNCPVIEVGGRLHPVQEYFLEDTIELLRFVPPPRTKEKKKKKLEDDNEENLNMVCDTQVFSRATQHAMAQLSEDEISFELIEGILSYIRSYNTPGAVLIFLPGWNVIFSLHRHLLSHPVFGSREYMLLPCHSQLPRDEQRRVFSPTPPGVTKVVIATNIAESSITIDDVVFVIDAAHAKIKQFVSQSNLTHFDTVWASRSSLEQRKGRAGRVRPGYCFHLCSRARYTRLPEHITPEILRTPLHELVLTVLLLKLGHPQMFLNKAMEVPSLTAINEAITLLREMQAIDLQDQLTPLGVILAKLPVDPRLGKMMVMGCLFGVGDAMCSIAASCGYHEPFLLSSGQKRLTHTHKKFVGRYHSDQLAMLSALQQWDYAKSRGNSEEWSFCSTNSINTSSLRMTGEARHQLKEILLSVGFPEDVLATRPVNLSPVNELADMVVALLCVGLYPNVCVHKEKRHVITSDRKIALLHKSSVNLIYKHPNFSSPYLVFEEKIRSKVLSARATTMVEPLHLMLFGSSSIESSPPNLVKVDDWLPFTMSHNSIALVGGVRHAVDKLLHKIAGSPSLLSSLTSVEQALLSTVQRLVSLRSPAPWKSDSRHSSNYPSSSHSSYPSSSSPFSPPFARGYNDYPRPPLYDHRGGYHEHGHRGQYGYRGRGHPY